MNPQVSVVVPIYNVEQYLAKCLDSLINQTYKDIEVIAVNDGSLDKSFNILENYAKKDARIRVINKTNGGLSSARNEGLKHIHGQYLMFVDSDDWIEINCIEKAISQIITDDVDIVLWSYSKDSKESCSPENIFDSNIRQYNAQNINILYQRLIGLTKKELLHPEKIDSISTVCVKLYKSNIIKNYNIEFTDTKIIGTEDLLFNVEYFKYIKSAVTMNDCLYHYRRNMNSLTHTYKQNLFEQWTELQNRIWNIIKNHIPNFEDAYNNRIALSILGLSLNEYSSNKPYYGKIKRIKQILETERYQKAYCQLKLKYFPLYWKMFFFCAKYKLIQPLYWMIVAIQKFFR